MSPLSQQALDNFHFHIVDTATVGSTLCHHLVFMPNNQYDVAFSGELFVTADTSLTLKRVKLSLPKNTNINFIDRLSVEQDFVKLDSGIVVMQKQDMLVEMSPMIKVGEFCLVKTQRFSDWDFSPIPAEELNVKGDERMEPRAEYRDSTFWSRYHEAEPLRQSEHHSSSIITFIERFKWMKWSAKAAKILFDNYIEIPGKGGESIFDVGPVTSLLSRNDVDGWRIRFGGQTTAALCPHVFFNGYVSHGFRTGNNYYDANLIYSFNRKKHLPIEFPRHNLSIESSYNICSPSERYLHPDKDNIFSSIHWDENSQMMFYWMQKIGYEYENHDGLRFMVNLKTEKNEATGALMFKTLAEYEPGVYDGKAWQDYYPYTARNMHNGILRTTELQLSVEYCPGRHFFNTKRRQMPVNTETPAIGLSHTLGVKGMLGGQYNCNATELTAYKRFFMGTWGFLNMYAKGGIQWDQVPYPLLLSPAANLSYMSNTESFSLIHESEFLNDRYLSLFCTWDMSGKLLNRVPYVNTLKLREFIGVKVLWGALSDKNNPELERNWTSSRLMAFPDGYYIMNPSKPYIEGVIGIHNILCFLNIDYVYRFTYADLPHNKRSGIRFSFQLSF